MIGYKIHEEVKNVYLKWALIYITDFVFMIVGCKLLGMIQ